MVSKTLNLEEVPWEVRLGIRKRYEDGTWSSTTLRSWGDGGKHNGDGGGEVRTGREKPRQGSDLEGE